jgi:Fe-S cluster biogenesis protein NfuA
MEEKVKAALESIRSILLADGGDVELVSVSDGGTVTVRLKGACGGCPMAAMTLRQIIESRIRSEVPEVTEVVAA